MYLVRKDGINGGLLIGKLWLVDYPNSTSCTSYNVTTIFESPNLIKVCFLNIPRIENWSSKLHHTDIAQDIRKAFDVWSGYSRLQFSNKSSTNNVDIAISFANGNHGDRWEIIIYHYYHRHQTILIIMNK